MQRLSNSIHRFTARFFFIVGRSSLTMRVSFSLVQAAFLFNVFPGEGKSRSNYAGDGVHELMLQVY